MELYILLLISFLLQSWIMFYDSLRTLQYILCYIFLFSSYVEKFYFVLEHMGKMLCAVI
jgi:hypothetical protein